MNFWILTYSLVGVLCLPPNYLFSIVTVMKFLRTSQMQASSTLCKPLLWQSFLNYISFCHSKDNEYPGTPTATEVSLSMLLIKLIQPTLKAQNSASLQISTLGNFLCKKKTSFARPATWPTLHFSKSLLLERNNKSDPFKKSSPCAWQLSIESDDTDRAAPLINGSKDSSIKWQAVLQCPK